MLHLWFYLIGIEFLDFRVSFCLIENEGHIRYVFDPLMGVIKIFGGDGVWTFIKVIH